MSKALVLARANLSGDEARRALLWLLSMGLEAEARRTPGTADAWEVAVPEHELDAAVPLVADALAASGAPVPVPAPSPVPFTGIWTWPHSLASLALAAACIAVHVAVHGGAGPSPRSTMIGAGAITPWLVSQGEWWRLLSAVFLHFDVKHLVANTSALLLLGPPLTAAIGSLRTVVVFVLTGIGGNVVSQFLGNEGAVKAGASGGVCGLLGALAGVAIGAMAVAPDARARRPAWQTLGALVALFGMLVGVDPEHDNYAHAGGVATGLLLGLAFAPAAPPPLPGDDA